MVKEWKTALSTVKKALLRRGRSEHDADDLLQEAWIRLAAYSREKPVQKPEAFLMRIALNLSIDSHRKQRTRGEEVLIEDVVVVDFSPSAESVLLARERLARLSVCLGRLTERTRDIVLANRVEGLTYAEISQRHGLSVSTVEKHMAKALLQLTTCMDAW